MPIQPDNIQPSSGEWQRGWRIVLGCALGTGTGIILLFFTFSIFILPLIAEFGGTRGDMGTIQALVIAGALGSPFIGRAADKIGFRAVFMASMLISIGLMLAAALLADSLFQIGVAIFFISLLGVGTTALTTTRPVNAWFDTNRGMALGLAASGVAIATMIVPPILETIIATHGWRAGFVALAGLAAFVGLPAIYFLVENEPPAANGAPTSTATTSDWAFLRSGHFWLMAASFILMNIAGVGFIGQMSPMIQDEGLSTQIAALALSFFAFGQLGGRLIGGWCLDRFEPRLIAVLLNLVPATGFIILWATSGSAAAAMFAAFLIGFQQGAELDIFAYFTARRFGIANYGTVYGALLGLGWIGNATGVISVGWLYDAYGDYNMAQIFGAAALVTGALMIFGVRLAPKT